MMVFLQNFAVLLAVVSCFATCSALPTSLVEEIKATELRDNKVKRAHPVPVPEINAEEHGRNVAYFSKPTAIKRGILNSNNLKNPSPEQQSLSEWEQEQNAAIAAAYANQENLANIPSTLYNSGENNPLFDDKTVAEYEKGFRYGTNKEKIDEALENAVLKSELYGEPAGINQYRYFGNLDENKRRRRRRDARRARLDNRIKREVDLTPEEILTILTLYENERQNSAFPPWETINSANNEDLADDGDDDEDWMDAPAYPHASAANPRPEYGPGYFIDEKPAAFEKRGRWNGFSADRQKRFMVAKKRNDPTRELRYLNGPNKNDFYTLSQLLSNQREPNVPLYHRLVL